jgi:plasmid stabilization system protein ParE
MNRGILYHSAIQTEIRDILDHYEGISIQLADDFWNELTKGFDYARRYPTRQHFDPSGRRRVNLTRFPYHFLFKASDRLIKVTVVKHNSRNPGYGTRRN